MDLEKIAADLKEKAEALASCVSGTQWYLFGSATRHAKLPADLDLLVVYQNDSDVLQLRKTLEAYSQSLPLHILFLRKDEEAELRFISEQRAMRIFPE
jgi:predicted nucleotidyltransferase